MTNASAELRIERLKAVNMVRSLMGMLVRLHTSGKHEEIIELWANKSSAPKLTVDFIGTYCGIDGIRRFFTKYLPACEGDFIGILNVMDIATPIIEVEKSGLTAKGLWTSPGLMTLGSFSDGTLQSCWARGKFDVNFIKEDGLWKICRLTYYTTFITQFECNGWTDIPVEKTILEIHDSLGPAIGPDFIDKKLFKPYSTHDVCNASKLIPVPPRPY